jgi:hypothetical protein
MAGLLRLILRWIYVRFYNPCGLKITRKSAATHTRMVRWVDRSLKGIQVLTNFWLSLPEIVLRV